MSRSRIGVLLAILLAAQLRSPADAHPEGERERQGDFALRAGRILTVSGAAIDDGVILVRGGRIAAAGAGIAIPEGMPVADFSGHTVIPGLVEAGAAVEGAQSARRSLSPDILAIDGFDFFEDRRETLAGGVTTLGVSLGSSRLLSGRGLVVKAAGHGGDVERRILRRTGGYFIALGEPSKRPPSIYQPPVLPSPDTPFEVVDLQPPVSRGGAFLALAELLDRARSYREQLIAYQGNGGPRPRADLEAASLADALAGRDPFQVDGGRAIDLLEMLRFSREQKVPVVFEGAREAHRIAGQLAAAGAPVIVEGGFLPGDPPDEDLARPSVAGEPRDGLAARLHRAGVRVAIKSPRPDAVPHLLLQAIEAARSGLTPEAALRAVTLTPAEILGVSARIGSIEPGKDADLVVLDGDPFAGAGRPVAVFIDGELVHPAPRDLPPDITVIRCGRIVTGAGEIPGGLIVLRQGKILEVGSAALLGAFPRAARVIDASRQTVIPGLIDAGSRIGMHTDSVAPGSPGDRIPSGGGSATYRVADAFDPADPQIAGVLRAGITTVILAPDPAGAVSGQLTAVKLSGKKLPQAVLKDPAGLLVAAVRADTLNKAKDYHDKWVAYEMAREEEKKKKEEEERKKRKNGGNGNGDGNGKEGENEKKGPGEEEKPAEKIPEPPPVNEEYDVLRRVFEGKFPAVVQARSDAETLGVLRDFTDKYGARTVLAGIGELGAEALGEIRRRDVGVLLGTRLVWRKSLAEVVHLPRLLDRERIRFAFRSEAGSGSRELPAQVAYAVREGWDAGEALRAMTIRPARLFGIDDRVGSIEPGKDADLVFLDGSPFSMTGRVIRVMVDGEVVHEIDDSN